MAENERKPVRDIRFAKKKQVHGEKPFVLAGPPPRPPQNREERRSSRTALGVWGIAVVILLGLGILLARQGFFEERNLPQAPENKSALDFHSWLTALKNQFSAYGLLADLSGGTLRTLATADEARKLLPGFLAGKQTGLLDILQALEGQVHDLGGAAERLVAVRPDLRNAFPFFGNYLTFQTHIGRSEEALQGIIAWLKDPAPHHLIVLLGNTSELRPGGGFIGSFADLAIASGTIQSVTVHDINDVDRSRKRKVVPPEPLQAITARWRAADANWFFDYPASARKTLQFMEESDLYASTTLDGAIALTPKVFEDILAVTGPIALSGSTTIDKTNVVTMIQNDVQVGQAGGLSSPKAILGELAPQIISRLSSLSDEDQKKILEKGLAWIEAKDMMVFLNDEHLAKVLSAYHADGALYPLTQDLFGDYFAAVNANIGGEKTDFVMEEHTTLQSHLDERGVLHDTATIVRTNHGNEREEWWYRADNWNYLMLFTPSGVSLEDAKGIGRRFITPKADYRAGFERDPDLEAVEKTMLVSLDGKLEVFKELNRNVFATWQKIPAGGTKDLTISYTRPLPHAPSDGMPYDFVFEKQAGAHGSFHLTLTAPVGFTWNDDGKTKPVFEYFSEDPPGRWVVHLTLVKQ